MRAEGEWKTVHGRCQGCGRMADLEVLDRTYGYCPLCGTTNRFVLLELDEQTAIAITEEEDEG
jgi:Zn finger protein HypA/HybF involved in hydrogenase expression